MLLTRILSVLSTLVILGVVAKFPVPTGAPLGYRTEINRLNSMSQPYTGALVIKVNADGILSGVYESDSIRPDPLYGQKITVTGTMSGSQVRIQIGTGVNAIVINGTATGHSLSGSANMRGGIWTFKGERVHLHNPPQQT